MRQSSWISLVLSLVTLVSIGSHAETLKVVTFNTEWFGLKAYKAAPGEIQYPGKSPKEIAHRAEQVKQLLLNHILPADAIVFEEVVDRSLLQAQLPPGWNCSSYTHEFFEFRHQHVMICAAPFHVLRNVPYDDNNTIEAVAYDADRGRPAVRVDLTTPKGRHLLRLVGVHLKAKPEFSGTRQQQVTAVAEDLRQEVVATVFAGDMNAFPKGDNGLKQDDTEIFQGILQNADPSFQHVGPFYGNTYRSRKFQGRVDHFFANDGVRVLGEPEIFAACNSHKKGGGLLDQEYYRTNVSDHCPVSITVEVN